MERKKEMEYHIRKMGVDMKELGLIINQTGLGFLCMLIKSLILENIKMVICMELEEANIIMVIFIKVIFIKEECKDWDCMLILRLVNGFLDTLKTTIYQ